MEDTAIKNTTRKYIVLIRVINGIENRLVWSELVYLMLNLAVFIFTVNFIFSFVHKGVYSITPISLAFILYCLTIGMGICAYWVTSALRQHLRLKLHYFQIRALERKMSCEGECIYSDAHVFFDPKIGCVESFDGKETLIYPASGFAKMTGFIGTAKPRHFSWIMPFMFLIIYLFTFIWVILKFAMI